MKEEEAPREMKIGLWGSYGHGLISDDILYKALKDEIESQDSRIECYIASQRTYKPDFVIIGGGTILGTPLRDFHPTCKWGVFGAGFRDRNHLEKLDKAEFVRVRGRHTANMLFEQGIRSEVVGDPICLKVYTANKVWIVMFPRELQKEWDIYHETK